MTADRLGEPLPAHDAPTEVRGQVDAGSGAFGIRFSLRFPRRHAPG